uniref:Uncharacterized protein n=1 Tax=Caenorhabditis japonica TaxID=281687 RepID=A0A8R1DEP5_CAEJA
MSANSPKRPRTEETEKRAVSFESLNSDDTFDNESPILRPTDSTDWIKNADKKRIVAVLRGEYPGLTIVKHSDVHAQSSGYSKIYIQKENDQFVYGTDFVICDGCGIVMGGNGGHLA